MPMVSLSQNGGQQIDGYVRSIVRAQQYPVSVDLLELTGR